MFLWICLHFSMVLEAAGRPSGFSEVQKTFPYGMFFFGVHGWFGIDMACLRAPHGGIMSHMTAIWLF